MILDDFSIEAFDNYIYLKFFFFLSIDENAVVAEDCRERVNVGSKGAGKMGEPRRKGAQCGRIKVIEDFDGF